jgi:hypothetical protein
MTPRVKICTEYCLYNKWHFGLLKLPLLYRNFGLEPKWHQHLYLYTILRFSAMHIGTNAKCPPSRFITWQQFNLSIVQHAAPSVHSIQTMRAVTSFRFQIPIYSWMKSRQIISCREQILKCCNTATCYEGLQKTDPRKG